VRGYALVSVPGHDWARLRGDQQRQQQYLMRLFEEAGVLRPGKFTAAAAAAAAAAA
jgi:hypothetical protein